GPWYSLSLKSSTSLPTNSCSTYLRTTSIATCWCSMSRPPPMIARETATPEPDHARPEGLSVGRHSPSLATRGCGGASRDRHAGDLLARLISRAAEPFCQARRRALNEGLLTNCCDSSSARRLIAAPRYIVMLRNRRRRAERGAIVTGEGDATIRLRPLLS